MRGAKTVAGGVLALTALIPAAPASAHLSALVNGRVHAYTYSYKYNDNGYKALMLRDLGKKQWVKAEYYRSNSSKKRTLWNKSGYKKTVSTQRGATITKLKSCEERDWKPDVCTKWAVKGQVEHRVK
ncbi:hypothetical protein [Actinomadura litoris]|uniref:hypothetical protein n=1 Tax=Actinomadura litoris TaxID=2678616 RepID=UPI001FA7D999|nr:hypothetical protein [Actinomadura litoris]